MTDARITKLQEQVAAGVVKGEFPTSLLSQYAQRGKLSDKQWLWVEKLGATRPAEKVSLADSTAMARIVSLFNTAQKHLKRPALVVLAEGQVLRLARAGERSKYQGTINVTSRGPYSERDWYGRINLDGSFTKSRDEHLIDVTKPLQRFAADPIQAARDYAKLTGHCCFCSRPLTDARSTEMGYGPICAQRWDLPWGKVTGEWIDQAEASAADTADQNRANDALGTTATLNGSPQ